MVYRISKESFQITFRAETDDGWTARTTESRPYIDQRITTKTGRNHGSLSRVWHNTERWQALQINGVFSPVTLLLALWISSIKGKVM